LESFFAAGPPDGEALSRSRDRHNRSPGCGRPWGTSSCRGRWVASPHCVGSPPWMSIGRNLGYLMHDRRVHPRVIQDVMLGAIPPGGYDLAAKFAPLLSLDIGNPPKPRGCPRKTPAPAPDQRQWLIEQQDKLQACILKHAGWLAFFYTDA